jgi:hypothetical protein
MREILVGSKVLPYDALFVVGRVWYRLGVPYAVPKFIAVVRDKRTGELRRSLTVEEVIQIESEISRMFGWGAVITKLEDLDREINERYKEELMKAKAEGKIVFSFADALFNKIAELISKKDPVEFEI